jgi:redox-sensitive bicupin YhaK (pirin superfamily)
MYYFGGPSLSIDGRHFSSHAGVEVKADEPIPLVAGDGSVEVLMLQGRPIGEPVVQYGPFVMNTREEIQQAFADYRHTRFGGWPWASADPNHGRTADRFAKHADGHVERKRSI